MKYYVVVLIYCFLLGVSQAQENQTIEGTGDPSREDDYYEKIVDLASLPATLSGHQRGPVDRGTWLQADHLSGNWNGLRLQRSDEGIVIESAMVADWSRNLKGGVNTHGETFRHLFDFNMTFDLEQLLGWEGTTVFLDFYNQHGADGSEDTGDIQGYSNIDSPDRTQLAEVWIQHKLIEESLFIKFGKMDTNADFAYVDNGVEFINSSAGFSPTIFMPTYPETAVGVVLFWNPGENLSVNFGVYDGAAQEGIPTGTRGFSTWFDSSPADLFLIGEVGMVWDEDILPGRIVGGGWRHTGSFDTFDGGTKKGTEGFYLVCEKSISQEKPDDQEDNQGTSLFLQYGFADQEVMDIEQHLGGGVQWIGAWPSRDEDITGIMVSWVDLSDESGAGFVENGEWSIELFHRFQLTGFFSLKPDIQYIVNPGGTGEGDSIVATLRSELVF